MFRKISENIAGMLVANDIVTDDNREAYIYGLELLIPQILFYIGLLVISLFTKTLLLSFLFVVTYKVLRQYTGGFHCKSAEVCLIVSVLIYLMLLLLFYSHSVIVDMVLTATSIISSVILFRFSPIEDKNKPLDDIEKGIYRNLSVIATIIAISLIIISFFLNLMEIFYAVAWSLSADAVLILLAIIRRCKNEEDDLEGSSNNC